MSSQTCFLETAGEELQTKYYPKSMDNKNIESKVALKFSSNLQKDINAQLSTCISDVFLCLSSPLSLTDDMITSCCSNRNAHFFITLCGPTLYYFSEIDPIKQYARLYKLISRFKEHPHITLNLVNKHMYKEIFFFRHRLIFLPKVLGKEPFSIPGFVLEYPGFDQNSETLIQTFKSIKAEIHEFEKHKIKFEEFESLKDQPEKNTIIFAEGEDILCSLNSGISTRSDRIQFGLSFYEIESNLLDSMIKADTIDILAVTGIKFMTLLMNPKVMERFQNMKVRIIIAELNAPVAKLNYPFCSDAKLSKSRGHAMYLSSCFNVEVRYTSQPIYRTRISLSREDMKETYSYNYSLGYQSDQNLYEYVQKIGDTPRSKINSIFLNSFDEEFTLYYLLSSPNDEIKIARYSAYSNPSLLCTFEKSIKLETPFVIFSGYDRFLDKEVIFVFASLTELLKVPADINNTTVIRYPFQYQVAFNNSEPLNAFRQCPIKPGSSIGFNDTKPSASISCFIKNDKGNRYGIASGHLFKHAFPQPRNEGFEVFHQVAFHPSFTDFNGVNTKLGRCVAYSMQDDSNEFEDFVLFEINADVQIVNEVENLNLDLKYLGNDLSESLKCRMIGRSSGISHISLTSQALIVLEGGRVNGCIAISDINDNVPQGGDSAGPIYIKTKDSADCLGFFLGCLTDPLGQTRFNVIIKSEKLRQFLDKRFPSGWTMI
eukprot:NODE_465_length_7087_cov_1.060962.p1 type:complete len:713 gc:universal NODE_465_length_7087_cov_1.060962:4467-6605(+)